MGVTPGSSGGGVAFTQGTAAAKPPTPGAGAVPYFATDTGEWWIPNAAGNGWQSIGFTSAASFFAAIFNTGSGASIQRDNTTGNLLSTKGIEVGTAGLGVAIKEGANAKQGTATLVAGTVTVANTSVTATSRILITPQEAGALAGIIRVSARVAGTSFTVSSTVGTDTVTFAYEIFEPA